MSVLAAFLTTWQRARTTFGEGTPHGGDGFDQSVRFRRLQSDVDAAAPQDWSGAGSDSYAEANQRQSRALAAMADLDQRLKAEVDRSAAVVAAGRRDLEAVRQWVVDAAATVPRTALGEQMLWPVISRGASEVADIVRRSDGELSAIARRMRSLGGEYEALRQPIPRAPADGTDSQAPDPQDVAQWYTDWEDLQSRIAKHNAMWPRPPINTPAGIAYQAEKEELDLEQSKLVLEAADLGIQVTGTETQ
ncbi:EspA/EspE family type VII secretion system effector [Mycobacterium sp. IS-3022]|uniref:EspA/EspE family type VII secretion system effector n=1 Tax=Mycobacterium sp. IS-3022 TaxID=1772277 RepID=UPI00074172D5|nr:EspA/EspE family type VII secretion system effector [Mycobacterium sp. IS-3022]KUI05943.1 hypothetical protein AU188_02315 [Mycobacterium sp. IS-3022]